ncbi:MAG: phosphoglycerate mutase (2,3-diphosphoglycerate-independent) [Rhodospirillaceae bacterium]|nr:phosphoglycerate mutase (2,3-diphosphoglycerate-independent) [Rhodospirillaceae bacterium]
MSPPVVLCILDGWGCRDTTADNAIALAKTPNWDKYLRSCPHSVLEASEEDVGLPAGQMGNSEVGHMNIGSGRVVMQDLPRIDRAILDGQFHRNGALKQFSDSLLKTNKLCHLIGLVSPGGVHSHQKHIIELAKILSKRSISVKIHALLDGRDTAPQSGLEYLREVENSIGCIKNASVASVGGRYFGMDRDQRWDRVQLAYNAIMSGSGPRFASVGTAIESSYREGSSDEFIVPAVIGDFSGVQTGDGLLMANFRADRVRQLLDALVDPEFDSFSTSGRAVFAAKLGITTYSQRLSSLMATMFPSESIEKTIGEVVATNGFRQFRIAETEKYAHVTFFLNGGREAPYVGEDRILVPSPKVPTYDQKPEMSAGKVADELVRALQCRQYEFLVVNFANTDMVGHTGNLQAAIKAVEVVDGCLGKIVAATDALGGKVFVTADHGNAEQMISPHTNDIHTAHTTNKVPFLITGSKELSLSNGKLSDIAPTILHTMGMAVPKEMTGKVLVQQPG